MEVPEEPLRPRPISEPTEDILMALTLCQVLEESPPTLRAWEPEQAPAPTMELPEEPVMTPAISEQAGYAHSSDSLSAATRATCTFGSPGARPGSTPAMEVPEGPLMPLVMSDPAQDIHRALTPCQQLQEPPAPLAAPSPSKLQHQLSWLPKGAANHLSQ